MRTLAALLLLLLAAGPLAARPRLQVVFSPNGGFDPINKGTKMKLVDGSLADPDLNVLADDMIRRVKKGGRIEIAMYAFSDMRALASMVDRARDGAAVRLVLDACASWTADLRKMVYEELEKQKEEARKARDPFDFQVEEIPCEKFKEYGRSKVLRDGKEITGTMHEKFGVFFLSRRKMPSHSFAGSSNFAKSAATRYGENRTFFWNDPVAAAQLHEEFQRLWKYWGECSFVGEGDDCETVGKIRDVEAGKSGVQMVFNGEPLHGGDPGDPAKVKRWRKIDWAIEKELEKVDPKTGTIDFVMFSFTHWRLKNKLLELAEKYPRIRVRVLFDLSMLADDNPDRPGVLGPMMEKEAKEKKLKNFEVRYKWRSNAHSYDPEDPSVPPGLYHFKSDLLHHKAVIVNRRVVVNGSYNWSGGAERRNLENIQIFEEGRPGHDELIGSFLREYDYLWDAKGPDDYEMDEFRPNPQVVTGPEGRKLQQEIIEALKGPGVRDIQLALDEAWGAFWSVDEIAEKAGQSKRRTRRVLERLRKVGLLRKDSKGRFATAD